MDKKVVRAYLAGLGRDETARKFDISGGTVSNILIPIKDLIGPEGVALRELSVELKQKGLTVEEVSSSLEVAHIIKTMEIDKEKLREFLSKVYRTSVDNGYTAEQVVGYSIELYDLSIKMNKSFEQLIQELKFTREELSRLQAQIQRLHEEEAKATEEKNRALTNKNLTIKVLNEYLQAKEDLLSFGQNIEDIPKLCNMLKNCADQRYNFNEFVKNIQETETLTERVEKLQDTMSDLEKKKAELEEKIDDLNATKAKTEESIKTIADVALPQIKSTSQEVNQLLANLKKDMKTSIDEVNINAEDSISKLQTSAQESLTKLQDILDKLNPAIDRLSKAEEFGEQVGKLETLNPLFRLCDEARGTKYEVFPVVRILLEKFKIWLSRHPELSDLREKTATLIASMDGELVIK